MFFILIVFAVFSQGQRGPDGIVRIVRDDGSVVSSHRSIPQKEIKKTEGKTSSFVSFKGTVSTKTVISWPKFRHDLGNTGSTTSPAPSTASLYWLSSPLMDVVSSPAIRDNKVFFGVFGFPGWVVCLDEYTGAELWHFVPPHLDYVNSSPAVKYGKAHIGDRNGYLWCLDEETRDTIWYYHANNGIDGGVAVDDSLVFFG